MHSRNTFVQRRYLLLRTVKFGCVTLLHASLFSLFLISNEFVCHGFPSADAVVNRLSRNRRHLFSSSFLNDDVHAEALALTCHKQGYCLVASLCFCSIFRNAQLVNHALNCSNLIGQTFRSVTSKIENTILFQRNVAYPSVTLPGCNVRPGSHYRRKATQRRLGSLRQRLASFLAVYIKLARCRIRRSVCRSADARYRTRSISCVRFLRFAFIHVLKSIMADEATKTLVERVRSYHCLGMCNILFTITEQSASSSKIVAE